MALSRKKLAAQLEHCQEINKNLEAISSKAGLLSDLLSSYDDLSWAIWELVPRDNTKTHGPTRRVLRAQQQELTARAVKLGVSIHQ